MTFDVVFIANGAGELYAYVRPVLERLSAKSPEARVTIVITPCQYATGREVEVAKGFPNVSRVITTKEYMKWIFGGRPPENIKFSKNGIVVFMGGDLLHAVLLSRKLKFQAIAYTHSRIGWKRWIKLFMVPDERCAKKLSKSISKDKLKIIGELIVDGAKTEFTKGEAAKKWNLNLENPIISFLPGSRSYIINTMIPLYLKTAKFLLKENPKIQLIIPLSPFLDRELLDASIKGMGKIISKNGNNYIKTNDFEVLLTDSYIFDATSISDLAVTIPGTNTAEIAALGKPMVMFFPVDKAHILPMEGINDLLTRIPLIAPILRRIIIRVINWRTKYFSLPNKIAGEEIIPEIREKINPEKAAKTILKYLADKEWQIRTEKRLKGLMGKKGASDKVVNEILNIIHGEAQ